MGRPDGHPGGVSARRLAPAAPAGAGGGTDGDGEAGGGGHADHYDPSRPAMDTGGVPKPAGEASSGVKRGAPGDATRQCTPAAVRRSSLAA